MGASALEADRPAAAEQGEVTMPLLPMTQLCERCGEERPIEEFITCPECGETVCSDFCAPAGNGCRCQQCEEALDAE